MVMFLGHCVTQFLDVGSPNSLFEQLLRQLRVVLSPNVMLGDVGQLREVTHRMLKFYEYVGIGRAEQGDWQSLV